MTKKSKIIVTIALMLGISLASLDTTIVGTAMPTIVGKLGGITLYSWVFSAYLLASTTTVPIFGKLADLFGRKPIFLFGTTIFLIGSAASGASQSMEQLILFRAIQGLGAGAVLPIVLTIIGDIFVLEERARVQGLFSGVWAASSIVGPALGGLIVDHFSWRWVFYINLPFGLLSAFLLIFYFEEKVERKKVVLDYIGTLTLSGSVVALLFALLQGGTSWAWNSLPSVALFALAALLLALFIYQESHTAEPILPLTLFKNRIIAISSIGGVILGVIMFGITSYIPLFMQGVRGGTATSAGVTLGPLLIAWPISSTLSGKVILRFGYRFTAVMGALFAAIGTGMVTLFQCKYESAIHYSNDVYHWHRVRVHEHIICNSCAKCCSLESARRSNGFNPICAHYGWYSRCCSNGNDSQCSDGASLCTDLRSLCQCFSSASSRARAIKCITDSRRAKHVT